MDKCPLCQLDKHVRKQKMLYGKLVCKKCYYALANRRQFAFIVDSFLFRFVALALSFSIGIAIATVAPNFGASSSIMGVDLFFSIVFSLIFTLKDGFGGKSPGKALMGVRAVDDGTGAPIGFGQSIKRNLPIVIPFIPLVIAFQLCSGHRMGDRWARTRVVWERYRHSPVFTGAPLTSDGEYEFLPSDPNQADLVDNNPFRAPTDL